MGRWLKGSSVKMMVDFVAWTANVFSSGDFVGSMRLQILSEISDKFALSGWFVMKVVQFGKSMVMDIVVLVIILVKMLIAT